MKFINAFMALMVTGLVFSAGDLRAEWDEGMTEVAEEAASSMPMCDQCGKGTNLVDNYMDGPCVVKFGTKWFVTSCRSFATLNHGLTTPSGRCRDACYDRRGLPLNDFYNIRCLNDIGVVVTCQEYDMGAPKGATSDYLIESGQVNDPNMSGNRPDTN